MNSATTVDTSQTLAGRFRAVRSTTEGLSEPLSPEDCVVQSMPDASPIKWHLAHTTWFFETFVLEQSVPGYRHYDPAFRMLFNSYYNTVGDLHPRPRRGLLTRPSLDEIKGYRRSVTTHVTDLLERDEIDHDPVIATVELGIQHEQQHQELMLTDVKHLLAQNPTAPVYRHAAAPRDLDPGPRVWKRLSGGLRERGHQGAGFAFDNEGPRHQVFLEAFELANRLITCGEYLDFMRDGGYSRPELWLADGWQTVQQRGWVSPLHWTRRDGVWRQFTLSGEREVMASEPVSHVSYYEADAFARWAGARLPTEAEWEVAASGESAVRGNFLETKRLHPVPLQRLPENDALAQVFGDVWEWTQSPYSAYPGYRPPSGALGEYNGKFMCSQMVLRGGSCVTPRSHIRPTYRNFFYPDARWQFSGIRLARDAA